MVRAVALPLGTTELRKKKKKTWGDIRPFWISSLLRQGKMHTFYFCGWNNLPIGMLQFFLILL